MLNSSSKRWLIAGVVALVVHVSSHSALWASAKLDPGLRPFLDQSASGRTGIINQPSRLDVLVVFHYDNQTAENSTARRYDARSVSEYLKQQLSVSLLKLRQAAPNDIVVKNTYFINNSATINVSPESLRLLLNVDVVKKIYKIRNVLIDELPPSEPQTQSTYNYGETKLDKLIEEMPQIDGTGVLIGHIDTGLDGRHASIRTKIQAFFHNVKKQLDTPKDDGTHGSHTAGTIVGGDRKTDFIGVAPGAKLLSSGPLSGYDNMLASMEFMLDPDNAPATKDLPRAVSNSWHCGGAPDIELFYRAISAWEAAGILPVFSAGNAGPRPASITPPHEHPATLAVGATGQDGKVTSFSSRGPGRFHDQNTRKPDITAPGKDIVSSVPGGRFAAMSGTSMAAPHVAGAVALVLQANPSLDPLQIKQVLISSSVAIDANGKPRESGREWNANYGYGKLDILAAVKLAALVEARRIRPRMFGFLEQLLNQHVITADRILTNTRRDENVAVYLTAYPEGFDSNW